MAATSEESSMAKDGREISVARISGSKQEGAEARDFDMKVLQSVSIQTT